MLKHVPWAAGKVRELELKGRAKFTLKEKSPSMSLSKLTRGPIVPQGESES